MGRAPKTQDIDSRMLAGCTGFVIVSIGGYLLAAWPFLVWFEVFRLERLARDCAIGFVPSALLGVFSVRRWGLPGATGFVAGALAAALFLYMRIDAAEMLALAQQTPPLDYPPTIKVVLPLAWALLSVFLAIALMPKDRSER